MSIAAPTCLDDPKSPALREAIRSGTVGVVVAYALDRLSRNQTALGLLFSEADHAGVTVEFVTERLDDTPEGRLLQSVRGYVAEVERLKISERTVRGERARVLSGKIHGQGTDLYGYRRDKDAGVRHIVDSEAIIVRRIFHAVIDGRAVRSIVRDLNAEDVPPPSAGSGSTKMVASPGGIRASSIESSPNPGTRARPSSGG